MCRDMRLPGGTLWPVPVTLDVTEELAGRLGRGSRVALRHPEGMVLAILTVSDVFRPDREAEAFDVYGTSDEATPPCSPCVTGRTRSTSAARSRGSSCRPTTAETAAAEATTAR